jgi:hypothetical protein|tara:strand:- start:10904 stop:11497 length:594 start_codon:yes stop_codon:yes gene_type:complete
MALTSSTADTPLDICSRALILIGAEPISSFDDGTTEATVAVNMYEDVVQAALVNSRWRFATNQKIVNRLTDAPTGRYDYAYQLPSDMIMLHGATVNGNLIEYQVYGDKLFADTTETDTVIVDYSFRASEVDFPSYFTLAVEFSLAIIFATSIARDASLASLMTERAESSMAKARSLDSQQQTTRKLETSRFLTARRS